MYVKVLSLIVETCVAVIVSLAIASRTEKRTNETRLASMKENVDVKFVTERNPYMRSER